MRAQASTTPLARVAAAIAAAVLATTAHGAPATVSFSASLLDGDANPGGQAVAWADFDQDGSPDLAVGFQHAPARLYRNTEDGFIRIEAPSSLRHDADYRSLSWGDFNGDGRPDLYVGFGRDSRFVNLLLAGTAEGFDEVAHQFAVSARGTSRQANWIDLDGDGDSDLFVAMRDRRSRFFRNDGDRFSEVSRLAGLADPRRSVGAVWLDHDQDGDLDLYLPNQSGDRDGFLRNDALTFTDIAASMDMDLPRRPLSDGSVGATVCDVNGDGHLDIFVPAYGPDMLWINDGNGGFSDQARQWGVDSPALAVGADCGDLDNDGRNDLVVVAYERGVAHGHDRIYLNQGDRFTDIFPEQLSRFDGDHGVRLADFDEDGDLDFVTTNRHSDGSLTLWTNELEPGPASRFLKVWILDQEGRYTRQGDEVRVYTTEEDHLIATGMVDTGGGYISQNMLPVHLGVAHHERVRVVVTSILAGQRVTTTFNDVPTNTTITVSVPGEEPDPRP